MNKPTYNELLEKVRALEEKNKELTFALVDAWPYVHGWCTIVSAKRRIEKALFGRAMTKF